jgi:hypothetical protein
VTNQHYTYRLDESLGLTSARLSELVRRKAPDLSVRSASGPCDELVPFDGQIEAAGADDARHGDLFVPIHLEQTLNRAVTAAARATCWCSASAASVATAASACPSSRVPSTIWCAGARRVKPAGDPVFGDLRDAGRQFTNPLREGDPAA